LKKLISTIVVSTMLLLQACGGGSSETSGSKVDGSSSADTLKVGLLTQFSGAGAIYGPPTKNVAEMAVKEINESGGLLGRQLELVVADTATDPKTATDRAKYLIDKEKVDVIFSELTSADREAALPVINKTDLLFFYNDIYEGGAFAENMFINGEVPQQQVYPSIKWMTEELGGKNWYVVGNDYIWPWTTTEHVEKAVEENGGQVLGVDYVPFGTADFSSILTKIEQAKPDFIVLEMIGDAVAFMKQFHQRGLDQSIKVLALAVDENMVDAMGESAVGMIETTAYFLDHDTPHNKVFLEKYYKMFGQDAVKQNFISIPTYDAIHLWALAVKEANSFETGAVKEKLVQVSFEGPRGKIQYDAESQHATLPMYLGEVQPDGKFEVIKDFGIISAGDQKGSK
jgi:urea transport system substrate-binding protein